MPQTSEGSREDGSSSGWVTQNYLEQEKLMALLADSGHFWEVLELVDVPSLTAVQNTGAVRDEEDLRRSRDMCLRGGCGGFVVKGGDFDAEGNEIDPPRGFLFRKTQAELRELARPVSEPAHPKAARPTLWLPPDDFVADSGFRAGLFPAPSMHIRWEAPRPVANVSAFACRVCVEQPTDCTYYMTCGFHCGYSGIQEHPNGKKQLLFSVWDAHGYKCEPLQCADGLDAAGCFAGEGCGAGNWVTNDKAAYANWSPGTSYTFCVRAAVEEGGAATIFACHVFTPEDQTWHSLGVIRRPQPAEEGLGKPPLRGLYSFIEEFGGTVGTRKAGVFGPAWVRYEDGDAWESMSSASTTSTVDPETLPNQRALLASGGHSVMLESGGEAFEQPGPYQGPLQPQAPLSELSSLPDFVRAKI